MARVVTAVQAEDRRGAQTAHMARDGDSRVIAVRKPNLRIDGIRAIVGAHEPEARVEVRVEDRVVAQAEDSVAVGVACPANDGYARVLVCVVIII